MDADSRAMLIETADKMFAQAATREAINGLEKGTWPTAVWTAVEEMGLPLVAVPEDNGGVGGSLGDLCAILRVAGNYALPVPLAETALAAHLLAAAGIEPPSGPMTIVFGRDAKAAVTVDGGRLNGRARRIPFARYAEHIVVVAPAAGGATVALAARGAAKIEEVAAHSGEPYDTVRFDNAVSLSSGKLSISADEARELAALCRCSQMAGAAQKALDIAVEYAKQRVQFGKSIGTFQAIQHLLAEMASYVAAMVATSAAAARDAEEGRGGFATMAAKTQCGEFAHKVCAIAHQVMAAMGFTWEHVLHHYTRRLWVWRRDYGSESEWGEKLGRALAAAGPQALWPSLTETRIQA